MINHRFTTGKKTLKTMKTKSKKGSSPANLATNVKDQF